MNNIIALFQQSAIIANVNREDTKHLAKQKLFHIKASLHDEYPALERFVDDNWDVEKQFYSPDFQQKLPISFTVLLLPDIGKFYKHENHIWKSCDNCGCRLCKSFNRCPDCNNVLNEMDKKYAGPISLDCNDTNEFEITSVSKNVKSNDNDSDENLFDIPDSTLKSEKRKIDSFIPKK